MLRHDQAARKPADTILDVHYSERFKIGDLNLLFPKSSSSEKYDTLDPQPKLTWALAPFKFF